MSLPLRVFESLDGEIRKVFVVTFTLDIFLAWRSKNRSAIKVKRFVATKTKTALFPPSIPCARVHDFFFFPEERDRRMDFSSNEERRRRRRERERERGGGERERRHGARDGYRRT